LSPTMSTLNEVGLPTCSLVSKAPPKVYKAYAKKNHRDHIADLVEELVDLDCWAIVLDGEQLMNKYVKKSMKEMFLENMYRNSIIDDPRGSVLSLMTNNDTPHPHTLEIYMFGLPHSYKYQITYDYKKDVFLSTIYMSQTYVDTFGGDFKQE
jgi:hypothetical protein